MGTDLITEILLRLPVKSLVRFKTVCKIWRSLISDPHFARSHFELAAPRLLFTDYVNHCIRTMDFEGSLHSDHISEPINCDFLSNYDFLSNPILIEGSCRGFLLMKCNQNLYLWNPSTHVHKPIPPSSPAVDTNTNVFNHSHGFGYHSSKDDYLVVRMPIAYNWSPAHLQFFSLRANTWKYIEGVDFDLPPLTLISSWTGLLFNEAIHWTAHVQNWVDGSMTQFIIAFDFMEKRLLEIPQPHDFLAHPDVFTKFALWVHGRCFSLSVLRRDGGDFTLEIWVMKKYKVQTSWTKTLVLSLESLEHFCPACSTKGGDIVFSYSNKLIKFSDEGVQGEELDHSNHYLLLETSVPMYTESMLSLHDVNE